MVVKTGQQQALDAAMVKFQKNLFKQWPA